MTRTPPEGAGHPRALTLSAPPWLVEITDPPADERSLCDALTHLANGRQGVRSRPDPSDGQAEPGFHVTGLYDTGLDVTRELVNLPHPHGLAVRRGGEPLRTAGLRTVLDMRQGVVVQQRELTARDGARWELETVCHLHAVHSRLGVLTGYLTPLSEAPEATLEVFWDNNTGNPYLGGVLPHLRTYHVEMRGTRREGDHLHLDCALRGTGRTFRLRSRLTVYPKCERRPLDSPGRAGEILVLPPGHRALRFDLLWSVPGPGSDPLDEPGTDPEALLAAHRDEWERRWRRHDIVVAGDETAQQGVRFALFHLMQQELPVDGPRLSPARGLSGPYHSGATFFDTELHKDAFWTWTEPAVARAHLAFRHATLPAAREFAAATGHTGARFPVAADDLGQDAGPHHVRDAHGGGSDQWNVREAVHISADVAHAVVRHHRVTGDERHLLDEGLELLLSTAEFAASVLERHEPGRPCGARSVTGPDEYHPHVDHNLFTNAMLRENLSQALRLDAHARRTDPVAAADARVRAGVDEARLARWRELASTVHVPVPATGPPAQHEGYFDLPDCAPRTDPGSPAPRLLPDERAQAASGQPLPTRAVKQADVVLLAHLLPGLFTPETAAAILDFYEPRTAHASSLSFAPHGVVAARLGRTADARRFLLRSARYDLDHQPRTAYRNGLHLSAYAGAWQILAEGMLGLTADDDGLLRLDPHLPAHWSGLTLRIGIRGRQLTVEVDQRQVRLTLARGPALSVRIGDMALTLAPGEPASAALPRPHEESHHAPNDRADRPGMLVP
ncbi:glycosyl hydrolase family 65 protein [Streptomyces sp. NPDC056580]|uniref:glycosyl hydrolase family 65 protein n=1 Tax=Streptomyces sp. NPDC056580 TaxID=3345872 RepID=UPI0036C153A6